MKLLKFLLLSIALLIALFYAILTFLLRDVWEDFFIHIKYCLWGCYYGYVYTSENGTMQGMQEWVALKIKEREGGNDDN